MSGDGSNTTLGADETNEPVNSFLVGLDFGTTFSSVSFATVPASDPEGFRHIQASDVKNITNWPGEPSGFAEQVPTEIWYPRKPIKRSSPYNQFDCSKDKASGMQEEYIWDDEDDDDEASAGDAGSGSITMGMELQTPAFDDDDSGDLFWGYTVLNQRYIHHSTRDPSLLVRLPKLMMLGTEYTKAGRKGLQSQLTCLVERGIIRKYGKRAEPDTRDIRDVITDFIIKMLQHTQNQLAIYHGYTPRCLVEITFPVPTVWSPEGSRIMQFCVEAAIRATSFGTLTNGSVHNLFIGSEPEAGIGFLIQNTKEITVCCVSACNLEICCYQCRTLI